MAYVLKQGQRVGTLRISDLMLRNVADPALANLWQRWQQEQPEAFAARRIGTVAVELAVEGYELAWPVKTRGRRGR